MLTVLGRPPQNAALSRSLRQKCQSKLERPAGSECAMCKVPVIPSTDRKNTNKVERESERYGVRPHAGPEYCETTQMDHHERHAVERSGILRIIVPIQVRPCWCALCEGLVTANDVQFVLAGSQHTRLPGPLTTQTFCVSSNRLPKGGHRGVLGTQCQKSHRDNGRSCPIEPCEREAALRHRQTRRA